MAAFRRQIMNYPANLQVVEAPIGWADRTSRTRAWIWGNLVAIGVGVLIAVTPFLVGIPDDPVLVVRSALVGVSVWGAP
jgi:hypothetical protein